MVFIVNMLYFYSITSEGACLGDWQALRGAYPVSKYGVDTLAPAAGGLVDDTEGQVCCLAFLASSRRCYFSRTSEVFTTLRHLLK